MVKSRNRTINEKQVESFASGAEGESKSKKASQRKYKRLTFSLTEAEDKLIDELSLKVRSFRCSRSDVLKAAIHQLACLPEDKLTRLLEKQKDT